MFVNIYVINHFFISYIWTEFEVVQIELDWFFVVCSGYLGFCHNRQLVVIAVHWNQAENLELDFQTLCITA